jgi:hypothetical protein
MPCRTVIRRSLSMIRPSTERLRHNFRKTPVWPSWPTGPWSGGLCLAPLAEFQQTVSGGSGWLWRWGSARSDTAGNSILVPLKERAEHAVLRLAVRS